MIIDDREYRLVMGSDLQRDGMFLELYEGAEANGEQALAECFFSDQDGSLSITEFVKSIPAAALAWLRAEGMRRLPPTSALP